MSTTTTTTDNRYELAGASLVLAAEIQVAKYRSNSTGIAYHRDGQRLIETPKPRGPISFAILAHEVGHHLLGHLHNATARWIEEVEAWEFALKAVQEYDLRGYDRVEQHARESIAYSFAKAIRRGVSPDLIRETYPTWWSL